MGQNTLGEAPAPIENQDVQNSSHYSCRDTIIVLQAELDDGQKE